MADTGDTFRDQAFAERLCNELVAGHAVVLATVLATRGSMPRGAGARMARLGDGSFVGTVGGGTIERMVQERCEALLRDASSGALVWLTQEETSMACGGDALMGLRVLGPHDLLVLRGVAALGADCGWLVEDWGDPVAPSWRLLTDADALPEAARASDQPAWDERRARFLEPLGAPPQAYVFGAGHVGTALVPLLAGVGFEVTVCDDRPEMARAERFPQAAHVLCGDYCQLADAAPITPRDYVVVLTHGHAADFDVLARVLPKRPAYVGCIGSQRKASLVRSALVAEGHPQELVEAIHLPIGMDILAVTPAEIAVSITAEMIRVRAEARPVRPHQKKETPS